MKTFAVILAVSSTALAVVYIPTAVALVAIVAVLVLWRDRETWRERAQRGERSAANDEAWTLGWDDEGYRREDRLHRMFGKDGRR